MSSTVRVTIDGNPVDVPAGSNLIEAAAVAGKAVPYYCWHPRLSVVGNCRICLCEVEGVGKLQIGCNTQVREGMAFHTENARVKSARAGVMELLLIHHPLDCPICDQAGECKLQDYAVDHGTGVTRYGFPKGKKPKNVSWGDKVVFDSERCILCTRCVRFADEIAGTDEIGIDLRGEKATLIVKGDGHLTSPYQMNVIDLCPVGALTSRDFRFKSRVWFMKFTETICTSCARGCNVVAGARDDRLLRMVPRPNPQVNDHWMCDHGRLHYGFVNDEERLTSPRIGGKGAPYPPAIARAAELLKAAKGDGILVVASPFMTNEELLALKGICDALGATDRWFLKPMGQGDDILRHPELCPNARGCALLGFEEAPAGPAGDRRWGALLYAAPHEGADLPADLLARAKKRVIFSLREREADVNLPLTTWIEKDGTVVSAGDLVQRVAKGLAFEPTLLAERAVLERLLEALDPAQKPADTASQAFARLARACAAFEGLTWQKVGSSGTRLAAQEASA